ncbi:MAG TPA: GNAT family N-acetyltransferase [Pseudomonadales bacterium]|nr:GNAT family N-acetyltransferase [Pseudomonadales bacterium]
MKKEVHVWYVEMTDPEKIPEQRQSNPGYDVRKVDSVLPELNRFLYVAVGSAWEWNMRLNWTYDDWLTFLDKQDTETWVAYRNGTPVGYFELEKQADGSTEISYFGVLPEFIGQGYGRSLLEDAIYHAWRLSGQRVWLHTCTLDAPQALPNYLSRGLTVFKEEDIEEEVTGELTQPWPKANKPQP